MAPRSDDAATAEARRRFVHRVIAFAHAPPQDPRGWLASGEPDDGPAALGESPLPDPLAPRDCLLD